METVNFTVSTREKPSPKLEMAVQYLREHPEAMQESSRSLSATLGISHTYVTKAKHMLKGE